ncbi:MAG: hypothetical protein P3A28_09040, partial [Gemmatimonadota bacterium]|nr:hypothetical protein [Gemmatimonadota bacterium]
MITDEISSYSLMACIESRMPLNDEEQKALAQAELDRRAKDAVKSVCGSGCDSCPANEKKQPAPKVEYRRASHGCAKLVNYKVVAYIGNNDAEQLVNPPDEYHEWYDSKTTQGITSSEYEAAKRPDVAHVDSKSCDKCANERLCIFVKGCFNDGMKRF